jgi:glycerophosphoryl diester phosphodiesterase
MAVLRDHLGARTLSKGSLKSCLLGYVAFGFTGFVPASCRHSVVYVPINVAPWLWGWDRVLLDRFAAVDAELYVIGPYTGGWSDGLDDPADLARLPAGYAGGISTDTIDLVAPIYDL